MLTELDLGDLDRLLGLGQVDCALSRVHEELGYHGRLVAHSGLSLSWLGSLTARHGLLHSPRVHLLLDAVKDDVGLLLRVVFLVVEATLVLRLEELLGEVLRAITGIGCVRRAVGPLAVTVVDETSCAVLLQFHLLN